MDRRSGPSRLAVGGLTFAAAVLLWYVATSVTHFIPPVYFPTPAEVLQALRQITVQGYADGRLHEHFLHSCWLVLMGFAVAVGIGVPLGMLMGWSRRAEALINPVFLLLRPIPPLAWIPLAIVWLGLGDAAKVLVIWFAAFVPAVINSYAGASSFCSASRDCSHSSVSGHWHHSEVSRRGNFSPRRGQSRRNSSS